MSIVRRVINRGQRMALRALVAPLQRRGLQKIGSGYGGWFVPPSILKKGAVCYSIGVGEDTSFDEILVSAYGCDVAAFDPTPRAIEHAARVNEYLPDLRFYPVGIWSEDLQMRFYEPADSAHVSHSILNIQNTSDYFEAECWSLGTAMSRLGHSKIDLLKLDIEGAEYEVLRAMLNTDIRPSTLCVEMHKTSSFGSMLRFIGRLKKSGYKPVCVDGWNVTFLYANQ